MIRINGVMYNAFVTTASDGSMMFTFDSNDTLEQIESVFQADLKVEVYEGNEVVAVYYNKETRSITVSGKDPRRVIVTLVTSPISVDVEARLEEHIREISETADVNGDGIAELAGMVSDMTDESSITGDAIEELAALIADLIEKVNVISEKVGVEPESEGENG